MTLLRCRGGPSRSTIVLDAGRFVCGDVRKDFRKSRPTAARDHDRVISTRRSAVPGHLFEIELRVLQVGHALMVRRPVPTGMPFVD